MTTDQYRIQENEHPIIYHQPNKLVKPMPTSSACGRPPSYALRRGLPRALGLSESQHFHALRQLKGNTPMLGYIRLAVLSYFALISVSPCAAQDVEKESAISSLIAYSRSSFGGPDAAPLKALLEPLRKRNSSLPEENWRALLADVSALVEGEILKPGSPAEVGLRTRLQVLSTEDLRSVEQFLRSPQYRKYQDAFAHRDVGDGTTDALMMAIQIAGPKIVQAAELHGFKAK